MLEKYCTSMFWMDFKTFSPKPISCNFRRTTVPKLWKENSKNENKNWNQGFFTEMRLKYFSQKSCQSIAFLWKDSKISFERKGSVDKKVWSGISLPSDLWCRDVRLPGLQNVTDLIDTSAQKYSIKNGKIQFLQTKLILGWVARLMLNSLCKPAEDNKDLNLRVTF